MTDHANITGEVSSLAFGGAGVLKKDGLVVFVPFTAPQDVAEVSIVSKKKRFAFGKLEKIIEPSPLRVTPKCPYFGTCGGCQLQHINYSAQLDSKKQAVIDALSRVGKVSQDQLNEVTIEEAEHPWGYRERIALHIKEGKIGFFSLDNVNLVEIESCVIFLDQPTTLFNEVRELAKRLTTGRMDILKDKEGKFLIYVRLDVLPPDGNEILKWAETYLTSISGLEISRLGSFGKSEVQTQVENLSITYSPRVFIQNNASQSLKIYREIANLFKSYSSILDLYSGIGISSLLLAKNGATVESIEYSREAVEWAKKNFENNQETKIKAHCGDVQKLLSGLLNKTKFEAALINPPRDGIDKAVAETLRKSGIKDVIYISCMPSTLARDIKEFIEVGYTIKLVKAFDMFPQTGHIETLLQLQLN